MKKKQNITYESEEYSDLASLQNKLKQAKLKITECQKQKDEYLAGWQRSQADLINYRRRQEEIQKNSHNLAHAKIISDILPILDSLDRAHNNKELVLVHKQLLSALTSYGLSPIVTDNQKFDPKAHEAVESIKTDKPSGTIISEIQKGYFLNNQVLRPSKVKVAK